LDFQFGTAQGGKTQVGFGKEAVSQQLRASASKMCCQDMTKTGKSAACFDPQTAHNQLGLWKEIEGVEGDTLRVLREERLENRVLIISEAGGQFVLLG